MRYVGCFAPNSGWRSLVVKAGDQAPCRRDKPRDRDLVELAALEPAALGVSEEALARFVGDLVARRTSTRLTWAQSLRAAFEVDILQCDQCGGRREVIAAIPPGPIATKILAHLGLPTEIVRYRPCDVWQVRGPPGELVPEDLDGIEAGGGPDPPPDEDYGMPECDELAGLDEAA